MNDMRRGVWVGLMAVVLLSGCKKDNAVDFSPGIHVDDPVFYIFADVVPGSSSVKIKNNRMEYQAGIDKVTVQDFVFPQNDDTTTESTPTYAGSIFSRVHSNNFLLRIQFNTGYKTIKDGEELEEWLVPEFYSFESAQNRTRRVRIELIDENGTHFTTYSSTDELNMDHRFELKSFALYKGDDYNAKYRKYMLRGSFSCKLQNSKGEIMELRNAEISAYM